MVAVIYYKEKYFFPESHCYMPYNKISPSLKKSSTGT